MLVEQERKRQEMERQREENEKKLQQQREDAERRRKEFEEKRRIEAEKLEEEKRQREEDFKKNMESNFSQQETQVRDAEGNRWIKCEFCGKIAKESEFTSYGGADHINLGTCKDCSDNNPAVKEKAAQEIVIQRKNMIQRNARIVAENYMNAVGHMVDSTDVLIIPNVDIVGQ